MLTFWIKILTDLAPGQTGARPLLIRAQIDGDLPAGADLERFIGPFETAEQREAELQKLKDSGQNVED